MNGMNDLKNNIVNKLETIGNNIKNNVHIYAGITLLALASCGNKYDRTTEYDGYIGKDHIKAIKTVKRHHPETSFYHIEKIAEDGVIIKYNDGDNNGVLNSLIVEYPDGRIKRPTAGDMFNAANIDYQHLRDTIPFLKAAAKKNADDARSIADSAEINKYFK